MIQTCKECGKKQYCNDGSDMLFENTYYCNTCKALIYARKLIDLSEKKDKYFYMQKRNYLKNEILKLIQII